MTRTNADVVRMLNEMTLLMKLEEGNPQAFRVRAYENAAASVKDLRSPIAGMTEAEMVALKGIGKSTATKIREYLDTGSFARLDELRKAYPPAFVEMTRIPGLGPKTLIRLRDELGINTVDDLRRAIAREALRDVPGLGAKSEDKLKSAIERLGMHGKDRRTPIAAALPIATEIVAALQEVPGVKAVQYCGSLRRFSETIGDIDVIVAAKDHQSVSDAFVTLGIADEVITHGETKSSILTRDGLQIDLRVVDPGVYGAAVLYFTGSKSHNIALRQRALDRGWTLNEYSLSDIEKVVAARTEASIYKALELTFVPPPMREDTGEVQAAAEGRLPRVVEEKHIKGDLHVHSDLSGDGRAPISVMVAAAASRGLEYLAITDHGENLSINGATKSQMLGMRRKLEKLQKQYPDMALLWGCELNIGADGGLDYDDGFLAQFDWTVASVHSHFDLAVPDQTARLIAAIEHPSVNAIGHLSGRMIGRRPGIKFDEDKVLAAAAATGTAIEINGALDRLDASTDVIRNGASIGIDFVINTDAHHPNDYRRVTSGVLHAQRAWLEHKRVANSWPRQRFLTWAQRRRG
ncbi:MAG: DNA polymerase/3'-5' exonuclease PolX [Acidimicrobiia bacterium]